MGAAKACRGMMTAMHMGGEYMFLLSLLGFLGITNYQTIKYNCLKYVFK
jgi:hypothetical protein